MRPLGLQQGRGQWDSGLAGLRWVGSPGAEEQPQGSLGQPGAAHLSMGRGPPPPKDASLAASSCPGASGCTLTRLLPVDILPGLGSSCNCCTGKQIKPVHLGRMPIQGEAVDEQQLAMLMLSQHVSHLANALQAWLIVTVTQASVMSILLLKRLALKTLRPCLHTRAPIAWARLQTIPAMLKPLCTLLHPAWSALALGLDLHRHHAGSNSRAGSPGRLGSGSGGSGKVCTSRSRAAGQEEIPARTLPRLPPSHSSPICIESGTGRRW